MDLLEAMRLDEADGWCFACVDDTHCPHWWDGERCHLCLSDEGETHDG